MPQIKIATPIAKPLGVDHKDDLMHSNLLSLLSWRNRVDISEAPARDLRIDAFRAWAVLAVICIHTRPLAGQETSLFNLSAGAILINQAARFAVPFFFLISGFLFAESMKRGKQPLPQAGKQIRRIGMIFLAWSIFYALWPLRTPMELAGGASFPALTMQPRAFFAALANDPLRLFLEGTRVHLWFLPALSMGLAAVALCDHFKKANWIWLLAAPLYALGLAGGSYAAITGLDLGINTRNGPFHAVLFVAIGFACSQANWRPAFLTSLCLLIGGFSLQLAEALGLWIFYQVHPLTHNFLVGTIVFSFGLFGLAANPRRMGTPARHNHRMDALDGQECPSYGENQHSKTHSLLLKTLSRWGLYTLGVYVTHLAVIDLLLLLGSRESPLISLAAPLVIYGLTLALVILLAGNRRLRTYLV